MSQTPDSFFAVDAPESRLTIQLRRALVEQLGVESIDAFSSAAKRGLEIGGILLGRVEDGAIFVQAYEPVESEHLYGPSYLLTERDLLLFEQAVSRRRNQPPGELRPVGFFRSQTRAGIEFDEQDNAIAGDFFNKEPSVCLLVKPAVDHSVTARMAVWSQEKFESLEPFPFEAGALQQDEAPMIAAPMPPGEVQTSRYEKWLQNSWVLLGAAAAMFFVAFLIWAPGRTRATAAPPAAQKAPATPPVTGAGMSLSVEQKDSSAILSWNHSAAAVQQADFGQLLILDGDKRQELRLDRTELQTGRVVYVPEGKDVSFQMQLFAPGHTSTESIRLLAVGTAPEVNVADTSTEPPGFELAPPPREQAPARSRTPAPPAAPGGTGEPALPLIAAAPPLQFPLKPEAPDPPIQKPAPAPVTAAGPRLVTSVDVEPVGKSGFRRMMSKLSPERLFHDDQENRAIPARALREVEPQLPPELISDVHGARDVEVKVTISRKGDVAKTELKAHDVDDRVAYAFVKAARQWTFEPARNDNGPVEGQALLHFRLRRLETITASVAR